MVAVEHKILLKLHDALCSTLTLFSLSGVRSNHLSYRPFMYGNDLRLPPSEKARFVCSTLRQTDRRRIPQRTPCAAPLGTPRPCDRPAGARSVDDKDSAPVHAFARRRGAIE